MRDALLFNLCLTVTLAYAISLTYRQWPPQQLRLVGILRLILLTLLPLILLNYPTVLGPGIKIDLRTVPVVMATLAYGPVIGLGVAGSALAYRLIQGGAGAMPAVISMISVLMMSVLVRRYLRLDGLKEGAWQQVTWPMVLLIFSPQMLSINLLPGGSALFKQAYLPLLAMNTTGFLLASSIISNRVRLLQATSGWQHKALVDELSGLGNRRQFEYDLATLNPHDLLVLIDVDHFKRINDRFGHLVGDLVIATLGRELPKTLRRSDTAYRYGGEEFAIILRSSSYDTIPDSADPDSLGIVAERLRHQIEALSLPRLEGQNMTVSLGVALCEGGAVQQTLERADAALYAAKHAGRNRVQVWSPELEPSPATERLKHTRKSITNRLTG